MRIVHVAGFDAAAQAWNLTQAFAEHMPIHDSHSILYEEWGGAIPCHATVRDTPDQARELLKAADVIVFHCGTWDWGTPTLAASEPVWLTTDTHEAPFFKEFADPAKVVIWLDGSIAVRNDVKRWRERYKGYRICATNADVADMFDAQWMPATVSQKVDECEIPLVADRDPRVLVHPYTDVHLKQHFQFAEAVAKNKEKWQLVPVQGKPHDECIRLLGEADLVADHMRGYFGVVTLEATALGRPVLLNVSPVTTRAMMEFGWSVPSSWLHVTNPVEVASALSSLAQAPLDLWAAYAKEAETWWCRHASSAHRPERFVEWLSCS